MSRIVRVKIPATTANLGPGFDCLGMALDMWNTIDVKVGSFGFSISGEGAETLSRTKTNLIYRSIATPFKETGTPIPDLYISCTNVIPLSRGLGSSSAAIVGGLLAGNELCVRPLNQEQLLSLAAKIEGHPDNVTPALLGGCRIVVKDGSQLITEEVLVPSALRAVLFIPDMPMPTREARGILAPTVSREDAVFNIGRAAMLVTAFATGSFSHMRVATQDRLHQPARQAIFPAMPRIFEGALDAGALGVFLSGGGSTILALATESPENIQRAMEEAAEKVGVPGHSKIVRLSKQGAHVYQ